MTELRLEGRVLDQDGRPVVGAQVRLAPGRLTTTTNANGQFAFHALPAQRFSLTAHKGELYAAAVLVGPEDAGGALTIRMQVGVTLIVHAFANHVLVVGARVDIDGLTAITDDEGIAIVRGLSPCSHRGWLVADGFGDERVTLMLNDDPGGIVERFIPLQAGARVGGVVLGRDGKAIPNAWVCVTQGDHGPVPYEVVANAEGKWHVVASAGRYHVHVQSERVWHQSVLVLDCDGRTPQSDLEIRLEASATISESDAGAVAADSAAPQCESTRIAGIVVDDHDEPVGSAKIGVAVPGQYDRGMVMQSGTAETDARGRFEVSRLAPGEYDVVASRHQPYGGRGKRRSRQRARSGDVDLRLVLPRGTTVLGRVLLDGQAMPYFGVSLTPHNVFGGTPLGFRSTEGRFALPHVEPGTWQVVVLGPGTQRKVVRSITTTDGEHIDLGDIEMDRGQRLEGHVRDQAGAPVRGSRVIIGNWGRIGGEESSLLAGWFFGRFEATTDANGAYVFDGIEVHEPPRPTHIWAEHFRVGSSVIRTLAATDSTVDFSLLGAGHIEGTVEGLRSSHALALAVRPDEPKSARMVSVGQDGRFRFRDVPSGDYVVRTTAPDLEHVSSARVTVEEDRTTSALVILSTTSIRLTLIVPPEKSRDLVIEPVSPDANVGGRMRSVMNMGTEEHCRLDYLRPGRYRVSLDGETWTSVTVEPSPEAQTIDLRS